MLSSVVLCSVLALGAGGRGATGELSGSLVVPIAVDPLVEWVARNPSVIASAAGSKVEWRNGNQFRIGRPTQRGTIQATMEDRIDRIHNGYQYSCNLVPGSSVVLRDYKLVCKIVAISESQSKLTIQVKSSVTLRITDRQLTDNMEESLRKVLTLFYRLRQQ